MASDKQSVYESTVALTPVEATNLAENIAVYKAQKRPFLSFMSGISAGACIALAFIFYTTTQTASNGAPWGLTKLVGGLVFSIGVIMVVLLGTELFTSSTLTFIARVSEKITIWQMIRNWIMVCLAVWLSYSGKTVTDKAFIMIMPIGLFVASGFEHCVANMFMIPMGIITAHYSSPEFWQQLGIEAAQYSDLDVYHFITKNLIPVTLGNIVGGAICVGLFQRYLTKSH